MPEHLRWIVYVFNPLAQLIEVSRWSLTGFGDINPFFLSLSIVMVTAVFSLAVGFFLRAETYLADEI